MFYKTVTPITVTMNFSTFTAAINVPQFSIYNFPYDRYINELPHFDITNHRAPMRFDIVVPTALLDLTSLAVNVFHTYVVQYPS